MVTMALECGADFNSRGRYGTALRAAALRGHDTVVRLLIDKGASIRGQHADAMQAAAFNGHLSTVRLLLDSCIYNSGEYSSEIEPAVEASCFKGHAGVAALFLQTYGSKAARTAFSAAPNGGHEMITQLTLKYEPRIRDYNGVLGIGQPMYYRGPDASGFSISPSREYHTLPWNKAHKGISHTGSKMDHKTCLVFNGRLPWLELGGDALRPISPPNVNDDIRNGRHLRLAAKNGFVDILKYLLDQGNDINIHEYSPDFGNSTPIEVAATAGQTHAVQFLLNREAKVGIALTNAVINQDTAQVQLFLRERPDISVDKLSILPTYSPPHPKSAIAFAIELVPAHMITESSPVLSI